MAPRFTTPHHKEGFELFLDTIVAMEDVWLVSAWQTIQWMRDPQVGEWDFPKFFENNFLIPAPGEDGHIQALPVRLQGERVRG